MKRYLTLLLGVTFSVSLFAQETKPQRLESQNLENLFRVHERLLSGGEPVGAEAFAELKRLGVTEIISVDGAPTNVELAAKFGLRYIHIPIGYDGIPSDSVIQLAKAAGEITRRAYVHCHHGKHRGPAAVGIMCRSSFGWSPDQTEAFMKQAGTSEKYGGLWQSAVRNAVPSPSETAKWKKPLPASVAPEPLIALMVKLDAATEKATSADADLAVLSELLREWERNGPFPSEKLAEFKRHIILSREAAERLTVAKADDWKRAKAAFMETCAACHKEFRD